MTKIVTRPLLLLSRCRASRSVPVCVCVRARAIIRARAWLVRLPRFARERRNFAEFNNVENRCSPMITRLRDRRAENNVCSSGNSVTAAQLEGDRYSRAIQLATTARHRSILPSSRKSNFPSKSFPKKFQTTPSLSLFLFLSEKAEG